jgi:outer membrane protein TolC
LAGGIETLEAESALLTASDAVIQLRAETNQDLVALAKALGGGWNETEGS